MKEEHFTNCLKAPLCKGKCHSQAQRSCRRNCISNTADLKITLKESTTIPQSQTSCDSPLCTRGPFSIYSAIAGCPLWSHVVDPHMGAFLFGACDGFLDYGAFVIKTTRPLSGLCRTKVLSVRHVFINSTYPESVLLSARRQLLQ